MSVVLLGALLLTTSIIVCYPIVSNQSSINEIIGLMSRALPFYRFGCIVLIVLFTGNQSPVYDVCTGRERLIRTRLIRSST